jgi:hypothetical protein
VIALAGVLFCYGLVELVEGYGFDLSPANSSRFG